MIVAASRYHTALGLGMVALALLLLALQFHVPGADMDQMQRSTVRLICEIKGRTYSGSGFVVDSTERFTDVVTNDHVARWAESGDEHLSILLARDRREAVQVVATDPDKDLAIVRSAKPLGRPAVQLADTASVMPGAPVTAVGFPGVADVVVDTDDIAVPSVSRGNVSRLTPGSNGVRYIQHTATTNPGNSGGPLYDEAGKVIAVNSRKAMNLVGKVSGGQFSADRIANGEGIAAAVDVAEILPLLKEKGVPYVMASLTPTDIAMTLVTVAVAVLLAAGGILVMTSPGRDWLFRRAAPAVQGRPANARAGKIRILGGALAGMDVTVPARVVLGRDPSKAQLVFPPEDAAVSRQHCEIRFDKAAELFEVLDLGSRNGTDAPRRLAPNIVERVAPGQNILVGSSRNRLVLELG
jgi:S1-C subfamily serine protease